MYFGTTIFSFDGITIKNQVFISFGKAKTASVKLDKNFSIIEDFESKKYAQFKSIKTLDLTGWDDEYYDKINEVFIISSNKSNFLKSFVSECNLPFANFLSLEI